MPLNIIPQIKQGLVLNFSLGNDIILLFNFRWLKSSNTTCQLYYGGEDMEDNAIKSDKYEPTTAELKLLEVMCNPDYATLNVIEICGIADIDPATYYRAMKKEGFKNLVKDVSLDLVKGKLSQIINATIKFAVNNPKCSADRKTLLQMADVVKDKVEHSGELKLPNIIITK